MTAAHRAGGSVRLRLVTYNILLGGRYREERIAALLANADPDVVALQEVADLALPRRIARRLGMRMVSGAPSDPASRLHNVLLTRFPVRRWRNHRHPGVMLRSHLEAELETGSAVMPAVRVHCLHLAARFGERANGEVRRMRELAAVFRDLERLAPVPHLIAGDFNAIAPDEVVLASEFFSKMGELRAAGLMERGGDGYWGPLRREEEVGERDADWLAAGVHPHLDVGIPTLPAVVFPVVRRLPKGRALDRLANRFIERWSVAHMLERGYVDCFRQVHPRAAGYTCATWMPAARIDYVFARDEVASRLARADVIGGRTWHEPLAVSASDHFPLVAEFRL